MKRSLANTSPVLGTMHPELVMNIANRTVYYQNVLVCTDKRLATMPPREPPHEIIHFSPSTSSHFCLTIERKTLLDLRDRQRRGETLRARPRAIEDRVTPVQRHAIIQGILALLDFLVSTVGDPAIRLQ